MGVKTVGRKRWWSKAAAAVRPANTVLDIGPGIRPQTLVECGHHICVEPHGEYVDVLRREYPGVEVMHCTWAQALDHFGAGSVDTVVLLDVIEHLDKEEGRRLLDRTVHLARSQVVVFTPFGFVPQGEDEDRDAWGLHGTEWQVHRSG